MSGGAAGEILRDGESFLVKGAGQLPGEIFDAGQGAEGGRRAERRVGRVRTKEHRRGRDDFPAGNREIERDVVAFETPSPHAPSHPGLSKMVRK